ncbi:MAG TPA: hypothetical protein VIU39_01175 [Anaerolineales bacterium]
MDDTEYLRAYEPILRFAQSERFFPMDAERYLRECQLFPSGPQGAFELLAHVNDMRTSRIGRLQSWQYYLRFVNIPLNDSDAWAWWAFLSASAILASWFIAHFYGVGIAVTASLLAALVLFMLASPIRLRIIPATFALFFFATLEVLPIWFFLRPHSFIGARLEYLVLLPIYVVLLFYLAVRTLKFMLDRIIPQGPGLIMDMLSQATERIAQEAWRLYAKLLEGDPQPVYYGRVVREQDAEGVQWTVIQYHFFYAFNDWRLAANGINHHEGDWEMIAVYLREEIPHAVLLSQHKAGYMERWENISKGVGADGLPGTHPIIYPALGSHANYSRPQVIRSASLYHTGPVQRFVYWADGVIHFLFLLINPSQRSRQLALQELFSEPAAILSEDAFVGLRDEEDHYIVSLPLEMASGDGLRIGPPGDRHHEGVIMSSSYLKRDISDRPVAHPSITSWRGVNLAPEPEWVEYKGRWGVRSLLENESGPPGPKWERPVGGQPPQPRLRWARPLDWLQLLGSSDGTG